MSNQVNDILMDMAREQLEWDTHRKTHNTKFVESCQFCRNSVEVRHSNRDNAQAGVL